MNKYALYIGMNDKDEHYQVHPLDYFYSILKQEFHSFTAYQAYGYYNREAENTLVVEIFNCSQDYIQAAIENLKKELNQENILVEHIYTETMFM